MSISFWCRSEPKTVVDTFECQCAWGREDGKPDPECQYCQGSGKEEFMGQAHEVNVAQGNYKIFLDIMGILENNPDNDVFGEIPVDQLPVVTRHLVRALNDRKLRAQYLRTTETSSPMIVDKSAPVTSIRKGATWIHCGVDEDYLIRKIHNFLGLVVYAQDHHDKVVWS